MALRMASWLLVLACACGGGSSGPDVTPVTPQVWSNVQKCEHVCGAYCGVRERCDGTAHDVCRMDIDASNGGTCAERAGLFDEVPQAQVERCIAAIQAMTCPEFERLFDRGEGVPVDCDGILN